MTDTKGDIEHVEALDGKDAVNAPVEVMGTVKLTDGVIVYIPAPTADPQGEFHLFIIKTLS